MSSRSESISIIADFKDQAVPLASAPLEANPYTYRYIEPRLIKLGVRLIKTVAESPPLHLWFSENTKTATTIPDHGDVPLSSKSIDKICADLGFTRADLDNAVI